jgi:predicted transcriptional regulator YdeE
MQPDFINREAFSVMGILNRIDPMTADYQAIWGGQFGPVHDQVKAQSTDQGCYGVYFATDEPGMADMLAGMAVGAVADVPEGLVLREVPTATYAVFECAMDALGPTWAAIYEEWLPASDQYEEDETKACLEYFPPGAEDGRAPVLIHVPVKNKGPA